MTRFSSERFARAGTHVGLVILFLGLFTFDIWGWGRLFDWLHLRVAADIILFMTLGGFLIAAAAGRRRIGAGPLDAPLTACLAAGAASALAARESAGVVEPLILLLIIVLWFKMLAGSRASWAHEERLLLFLLVASGGFAMRVLLDFVEWYAGTPFSPPDHVSWLSTDSGFIPRAMPYFGLASGATTVGAYLAMLAPPAAGWLLQSRDFGARTLLGGWLLLAGAAIWLAQSRSGWLAAGTGCLVLVILLFSGRRTGNRPLILFGLAGAALLLAALVITVTGRLPSTLTRIFIWGDALRFWMEKPIFGWGPGNFVVAQLESRPSAPLSSIFWQAHNLPLHLLAVIGGAGLAACGWLLWRAVGLIAAAGRTGPLRAGYAGGLAGFLAWNLADARTDSFLLWGTAAGLLAFAVRVRSPEEADREASVHYRALLCVLVVLFGGALFLMERDHLPAHIAGRLAAEGRWDDIAAPLEQAAATSTVPEFYWPQAGLAAARAGRWEVSDRLYRRTEATRGWAEPLANAAVVAMHNGDSDRAINLAARAMSLSSLEARYPLLLGDLHYQAGRHIEAAKFYGTALGLEPTWVASDYWSLPPLSGRRDEVVEAAITWLRTSEELGTFERVVNEAELLLRLGRHQEAEAAADRGLVQITNQSSMGAEAALLLGGEVRDPVARERARFSQGHGPTLLHALLGKIALERGDMDAAHAAFTRAVLAAPAYPPGRAGLSMVASARGDHTTALREARLGVLYGGERAAQAVLGRALAAAGHPQQALPHLQAGTRATRYYTTWFGLLAYKRREILPNLLPDVRDLAPDGDIAAVERELAHLEGR